MIKNKVNLAYVHVKNYLANDLGINRTRVWDIINARLDKLITKTLNDKMSSSSVEELIASRITDFIQHGFRNNSYRYWSHSKVTFEEYVKKCLSAEITRIIHENKNINITLKEKVGSDDGQ